MLTDGVSRRQLLDLVKQALLDADTIAGTRVFDWGAWPTDPKLFPMLMASVPRERKTALYPGLLEFRTVMTVAVVGRITGDPDETLGDELESFSEQVCEAMFLNPALAHQVQQFVVLDTQSVVATEGQAPYGEIGMTFEIAVYQAYATDGTNGQPLESIIGTIDQPGPQDISFTLTLNPGG